MSVMQVFDEDGRAIAPPIRDNDRISAELKEAAGIRLEHWRSASLPADADQDTILAAYRDYIEALNGEYGFEFVDVSALWPDHPKKKELRQKFGAEHTHSDDEIRFFVEGSGLFYFHVDDNVYLVLCEKGDLISVPAKTSHWFDMGSEPDFTMIRFFPTEDGWIAENTGDDIAGRLPDLDEFVTILTGPRQGIQH